LARGPQANNPTATPMLLWSPADPIHLTG